MMEFMNKTEYTMADFEASANTRLPEIVPQDLSGKVVIVTGANAGLGFEIAKSLASMNPQKLILACRNLEKAHKAALAIRAANPTYKGELEEWHIDQSSFESVRKFSERFLELKIPLDLLVCNAGLASHNWAETGDNLEVTVQVNHLSTMLLVLLLVPALQTAKNPRVEVVASDTHFWASGPQPDDPHPVQTLLKKENANPRSQYSGSKLLNILFAKEFAKRCPLPIWICATNPGYTESELASKDALTGNPGGARPVHDLKIRETYEGAKTLIHAAISPNVGPTGGYYSEMRESRVRTWVQGEVGATFAANVWKDSVEILRPELGVTPQAWMGF